MRVLVTGVGGQLGHDVMNELSASGYEGVGCDIQDIYSGVQDGTSVVEMPYIPMDITDVTSVKAILESVKPNAVVHCVVWKAVDAAEDEDKQAKVRAVNVDGTQNIANVCKELDCKMVYLSTDYVFDGQGTKAWEPECKANKPLNVYR